MIYIVISLVSLVLIGVVAFIKRKSLVSIHENTLLSIAFSCILAGIYFGDERFIGYSLIGIGIALAIYSKFRKSIA